jgi:predicted transcriptional regulator
MISFAAFKKELLKDPKVKAEYDRIGPEFALAEALIKARLNAKMTQGQVARRMGTTQSAVARMESGNGLPSTTSLVKYAHAVGKELKIALN